jgi:hypothetical protein
MRSGSGERQRKGASLVGTAKEGKERKEKKRKERKDRYVT